MQVLEKEATLPLRADGGIRLVVVADTHSRPHPDAAKHIVALGPNAILHAGDIGERRVLDELSTLAPLFMIRGNIDVRASDLPDILTLHLASADQRVLTLLMVHIALRGPKLMGEPVRLAREKGAQLLVCGHSHVPFVGRDKGLLVFNPGSVGPRRFQLPIVFGVIELVAGKLDFYHVDAESGERWEPWPRGSKVG